MSHAQRHIPLGAPLLTEPPHARCAVCVIVPARNEEQSLARTLDALRLQNDLADQQLDHRQYEVILLLNNCTDRSEAVAHAYQRRYPSFQLHVALRQFEPEQAHVGTARRLLMDTAYERLDRQQHTHRAILSTDGDTVVASDWIARNLAALEAGADVVGGVIDLFPDEMERLAKAQPGTMEAYRRDREFQHRVARLEALLDPDQSDLWPRNLQHFGASLACTPAIYALAGGLPPVKPLEDIAFVDALRRVGARIRHCPDTHIFTSARLDGRAEVGLSGQLRHWQQDGELNRPHVVDSAAWLVHRFRTLEQLRRLNEADVLPSLGGFPQSWQARLVALHATRLPTPRFLEQLDCNLLIEQMFVPLGQPRCTDILTSLAELDVAIETCKRPELTAVS